MSNIKTQLPEFVTTAYYQIAGLDCEISFPKPVSVDKFLISSTPFRCNTNKNNKFACKIAVNDTSHEVNMTSSCFLTEARGLFGDCVRLYETGFGYTTIISFENEKYRYVMDSNRDFSDSIVYLATEDLLAEKVLTFFFMIAFSQMAVLHDTVLIHASVIEKDNQGFAFLGKSGTGKSTHSSLWLRYIEGTSLLNDDNPALQVTSDGRVYVCGTPWSGKTPCYINKSVQLKALVRLQQAPKNKISKVSGTDALIALLPSCSSLRWNDALYSSLCDTIEKVMEKVPIFMLKCLPDKAAAELCYNSIDEKI